MDKKQELNNAFKTAMKSEIEGRELYKIVSEQSDDPKAKEVFLFLSQEENNHLLALQKMFQSYQKGESLEIPKITRLVRFDDTESPIFSRDFKERLKGKHFEMSALSIALRLENDSAQYYRECAEKTEDDALKAFFLELSDWEREHYNAFYREISYLEEEYFIKNNFEPFL